ncbi:MAG: hypothetical protein HFG68_13895 [Hungatella sp.]|nr:hypothetical protein [Hungatella sp.]
MFKPVKSLMIAALSFAIFAGPASIDTFASEEKNAQVPVITNTVENGGYYQVYEGSTKVSQQGARIVVSKQVRVVVKIKGNVTPNPTYRYSIYDNEYGTTMTGTLNLVSYNYDDNLSEYTSAVYEGTVFGNI